MKKFTSCFYILAIARSDSGFPVLWLFENGDGIQYKGPKDIKSLAFFTSDRIRLGAQKRKVSEKVQMQKGTALLQMKLT